MNIRTGSYVYHVTAGGCFLFSPQGVLVPQQYNPEKFVPLTDLKSRTKCAERVQPRRDTFCRRLCSAAAGTESARNATVATGSIESIADNAHISNGYCVAVLSPATNNSANVVKLTCKDGDAARHCVIAASASTQLGR